MTDTWYVMAKPADEGWLAWIVGAPGVWGEGATKEEAEIDAANALVEWLTL